MNDHIILLEHDVIWAEKLINPLKVRGWTITWVQDLEMIYQQKVEGVYLLSLSYPNFNPEEVCQWLRRQPKGENISIFLLNDGNHVLRTFGDVLTIGADGLYFKHNQLPLLLANFPSKHHMFSTSGQASSNTSHNQSSSRLSRELRLLQNQERVESISLSRIHKELQSIGYATNTSLLRSEIERALIEELRRSEESQPSVSLRTFVDTPKPYQPSPSHFNSSSPSPRRVLHHQPTPPQSSSPHQSPSPYSASNARSNVITSIPNVLHQSVNAQPVSSSLHTHSQSSGYRSFNGSQESEPTPVPHQSEAIPWGQEIHLAEVDFAQCFVFSFSHQQSLLFKIITDSEHWTIYLKEGEITGIISSHQEEVVLTHLLTQSLLTSADIEYANQRSRDEELFDWLLDHDSITPRTLQQVMIDIALRQIHQIFGLTEGMIYVEPYDPPVEPFTLPFTSLRLILNGVTNSYSRFRLYERFGQLKMVPRVRGTGLFRNGLTVTELTLLKAAKGQLSIAKIAAELEVPPLFALSFYYVFVLLGEVQIEDDNPLVTFSHRVTEQDYFQLLSLPYDAQTEHVQDAWRRHRQWIDKQGDTKSKEIREVIDILDDAYRVLAHDILRSRYLSSLEKPVFSDGSIIPQQISTRD